MPASSSALLALVPRLLAWIAGRGRASPTSTRSLARGLPGAFVFLPLSSGAGLVRGAVATLLSSSVSPWLVVAAFWALATAHGGLTWRCARAGVPLPPERL
jgi:hypothetical protein